MALCFPELSIYQFLIPLLFGYLLDLLIGDPPWMPHPIRFFGWIISHFEKKLNQKHLKLFKGCATTIILVSATLSFFSLIQYLIRVHPFLYYPFATIFVFFGQANKTLILEVQKVNQFLVEGGVIAGRKQLSFIVGRDTTELTENQIRIASLETLSENLSDGVFAPLFYYALGGVPLMMVYKMTNTLDSMIGYKNDRFAKFGWCSARLDDVLNYIPARITAFLMAFSALSFRSLRYIFKYGHQHSSPNSGYPEAALAGILACRFGGPNRYNGIWINKPYIGNKERTLTHVDIQKACRINLRVSLLTIAIIVSTRFMYLY